MKISNLKDKTGFTLLETIIAVFVVTVGLIGIFISIQNLNKYISEVSDKLIASYLAQEGLEIIRNIRDTNWIESENPENPDNSWDEGLSTNCINGCEVDYFCTTVEDPNSINPQDHNCLKSYDAGQFLKIDSNGFYNYTEGSNTKFKRKITITKESIPNTEDYALLIKAEIFRNYEIKPIVEVMEKLYNWKE